MSGCRPRTGGGAGALLLAAALAGANAARGAPSATPDPDPAAPAPALETAQARLLFQPGDAAALRAAGRAAQALERPHLAIYYFGQWLTAAPDDREALAALAGAQYAAGLDADAQATYARLLALAPDDAGARQGLALSVARQAADIVRQAAVGVPAGAAPAAARATPLFGALPPDAYALVIPYGTLWKYGGETVKRDGTAYGVFARIGRAARGYLDVTAADTTIDWLRDDGKPYREQVVRLGLGWQPSPGLLLKAKGGYAEANDDAYDGGTLYGAGIEAFPSAALAYGLDAFAVRYAPARTWQFAPHITLQLGRASWATALSVQTGEDADGDGQTGIFVEERGTWRVADDTSLGVALGAGKRRYGVSGFADTHYVLADAQRLAAGFDVQHRCAGWVVTFSSGYERFDAADGGSYHEVFHALALGRDFENSPLPLVRPEAGGPWGVAAGWTVRRVGLRTQAQAPAPLIGRAAGPFVFGTPGLYQGSATPADYADGQVVFDPGSSTPGSGFGTAYFWVADPGQVRAGGGAYDEATFRSLRYDYRLDGSLDGFETAADDVCGGPYVSLDRALWTGANRQSLRLAGRYTFTPVRQDSGWRTTGRQSVSEDVTTWTETYAVAGTYWVVYDPATYVSRYPWLTRPAEPGETQAAASGLYGRESYAAATRCQFDATLHACALGLAWEQEWPWLRLALGGGATVTLADWQQARADQWTRTADDAVVSWAERAETGTEVGWGAQASASARLRPGPGSRLFLELYTQYEWLAPATIRTDFATTRLDAASLSAGLGAGCWW